MAALPDERDLLPDAGILAKFGRDEEAPLLVRLAFGGVGKRKRILRACEMGSALYLSRIACQPVSV